MGLLETLVNGLINVAAEATWEKVKDTDTIKNIQRHQERTLKDIVRKLSDEQLLKALHTANPQGKIIIEEEARRRRLI